MEKKTLSLQVQNLKFELSEEKPNWFPFTGTCLFVDEPSSGIPSGGSEDKPVLFPKDEVEKSLTTFENMGVDCVWPEYGCPEYALTGHDTRNKIGVISSAEIVGNEVVIKGGLWEWDFEDVCDMVKLAKSSLGWSVEVRMYIEDSGDYYTATDLEFSGVALLYASAASFDKTYLAAKRKDVDKMSKEEMQALLNEMLEKFDEKFSKVSEKVEKISEEFSAEKEAKAKEKADLELAAKEAEDARIIKETKEAEEKAALELAAKEKADADAKAKEAEPKRKTIEFGTVVNKFKDASDEAKAIIENDKLNGSQKFKELINLRLQAK